MIIYDPHRWCTLLKLRGSIFPKALLFALPSGIAAGLLKISEKAGLLSFELLEGIPKSSVYSGFTFVLGFALVFRAGQAYSRYWWGATSIHDMRAEWYTCCASLVAFAQVSKKPADEVHQFIHVCVRLFCLLNAMALEEIADLFDENFPLLDVQGLSSTHLQTLSSQMAQGRKVEVVFQWIQIFICKKQDSGLLNGVPPPVLTRAFQYLGNGLVHYHKVQQISIWPFPFVYAQMNVMLILLYLIITPFFICTFTDEAISCVVLALTAALCMLCLDLSGTELENPFGEDANDLPTWELQLEMNHDLLMLLNPEMWSHPELSPTAITNFNDLTSVRDENRMSLHQYQEKLRTTIHPYIKWHGTAKLERQKSWAKQQWSEKAGKVEQVFDMSTVSGLQRDGTNQDETKIQDNIASNGELRVDIQDAGNLEAKALGDTENGVGHKGVVGGDSGSDKASQDRDQLLGSILKVLVDQTGEQLRRAIDFQCDCLERQFSNQRKEQEELAKWQVSILQEMHQKLAYGPPPTSGFTALGHCGSVEKAPQSRV